MESIFKQTYKFVTIKYGFKSVLEEFGVGN